MGYAFCNHTGCDKKEECVRFSEDMGTHYIRFETLMDDDGCRWFIKSKKEIVKTEEPKKEPVEEAKTEKDEPSDSTDGKNGEKDDV